MGRDKTELVEALNHDNVVMRLESLEKLMGKIRAGEVESPVRGDFVNNHIHTTYSFSPYSPAKAVWMAYNAGLATAGIMDHDSVGGAREFIEAGRIAGLATTIGVECRADFSGTPLNGRRINNPDQNSVAYIALHGIPHTQIDRVRDFFAPCVGKRNLRNCRMVDKINRLFNPYGIALDFEKDVAPVSRSSEGGSITERHLMFALSHKLVEKFGRGRRLFSFLKNTLELDISPKIEKYLSDSDNAFYEYDLLGLLKSELISSIYIDASDECPNVKDVLELSKKTGSIAAYAYLGDVGESVTGDKKSQKFEDDYIELLFEVIADLGFEAVTYMPSRNSMPQLEKVRALCERYGLFQISGEDINSPRQPFVCEALKNSAFQNLIDSTWALIGHEAEATEDLEKGMFSGRTVRKYPTLEERIRVYSEIGKRAIGYGR